MTVAWHANYVLKISGSTVNYANENRRISEKVAAAAGDTYRLSCSANWNNALYVIYAADNSVLACRQAPNNAAGEVLTDFAVTMPETLPISAWQQIWKSSRNPTRWPNTPPALRPKPRCLRLQRCAPCWIFCGRGPIPKASKAPSRIWKMHC